MDRRTFVSATGAVLATAGLAGCFDDAGPGVDTETAARTDPAVGEGVGVIGVRREAGPIQDNLRVRESRLVRRDGGVAVVGTLANTSETVAFPRLELEATVLDADDEVLATSETSLEGAPFDRLEPGGTWDFEIAFPDVDAQAVAGVTLSVTGAAEQVTATDEGLDVGTETGDGAETDTATDGA